MILNDYRCRPPTVGSRRGGICGASFLAGATALSTDRSQGCWYCCETGTLLCPISFMIVDALAPASPKSVPKGWRRKGARIVRRLHRGVLRREFKSTRASENTAGFFNPCVQHCAKRSFPVFLWRWPTFFRLRAQLAMRPTWMDRRASYPTIPSFSSDLVTKPVGKEGSSALRSTGPSAKYSSRLKGFRKKEAPSCTALVES